MSPTIVYFVTGANRGIGLALVSQLVKKPNVYVFAAARTESPALKELAVDHPGELSIVHFLVADEASNKAAAKIVNDKLGRVDTVLGVAGIADFIGPVEETTVDTMNTHLNINATGTLVLYQAFASLLRKSDDPKFIPFTSGWGSLTAHIGSPAGSVCYGASKAALNYIARRIHFENQWITCFPLTPGMVLTDLAFATRPSDKTGTVAAALDSVALRPEVAATLLIGVIESATRDTHGGEFMNIRGLKVPW